MGGVKKMCEGDDSWVIGLSGAPSLPYGHGR